MSEAHNEPEPAPAAKPADPVVIEGTAKPAAEPEAAAPKPETRKSGSSAAAWLAAIVLLLLGAGASSPYWAPPLASLLPWAVPAGRDAGTADLTALQSKIAALEARVAQADQLARRLAATEQRLSQIEERLQNLQATSRDTTQANRDAQVMATLADRLAILEERVAALNASALGGAADATKALQAETQALSQKLTEQAQLLAKLDAAQAGGPDRIDAALLIAVGNLRGALASARPYGGELAAAETLARDRPDALTALKTLDARAPSGIPSLALLSERYPAAATAAMRALSAAAADDGWDARILAKLKELVTIRRVGDRAAAASAGPESALAAAQSALKSGDLAGALAALKPLPAPAADAMKPWLADAQARVDAEATLAGLESALAQRFLSDRAAAGAKP
jgi:hypothetical protein